MQSKNRKRSNNTPLPNPPPLKRQTQVANKTTASTTNRIIRQGQSWPRGVPRATPAMLERMAQTVCGLTDPFCEHARGAKYPDDSSIFTLPASIRQSQTISSDPTGLAGFLCTPSVRYDSIQPIDPAFSTPTSVSTFNTLPAASVPALTGSSKFRIVSAGLRIKRISPNLTTSGMVYIRVFNTDNDASLTAWNPSTYSCSQYLNIPLSDANDVVVILPHTSQMPQNFYEPNIVNPSPLKGSWTSPGLAPVAIVVVGAPVSTPLFVVEYICNVEYTFEDNAPLGLIATPAPRSNHIITSAASAVTSLADAAIHAVGSKVSTILEGLAVNALHYAVSQSPLEAFSTGALLLV